MKNVVNPIKITAAKVKKLTCSGLVVGFGFVRAAGVAVGFGDGDGDGDGDGVGVDWAASGVHCATKVTF